MPTGNTFSYSTKTYFKCKYVCYILTVVVFCICSSKFCTSFFNLAICFATASAILYEVTYVVNITRDSINV